LTPSFGGLIEHQCPRCVQPVELPLGELCPTCVRERARRANRIARLVALTTTGVVGLYVLLRVPPDPTARLVSGISVAVWYLLSYLVVKRMLREFLR
jgi:hypothetical protein